MASIHSEQMEKCLLVDAWRHRQTESVFTNLIPLNRVLFLDHTHDISITHFCTIYRDHIPTNNNHMMLSLLTFRHVSNDCRYRSLKTTINNEWIEIYESTYCI